MSTATGSQRATVPGGDRVPEPPAPGERGKFRRVERAKRGPGHWPLVGVEVDFDPQQSAWLRAEADRTGLNYVALVRRLVDRARADDAPASARSAGG